MKITMAESNPDLELLTIMLLQPQCSGWRQYDANNDHVSSLVISTQTDHFVLKICHDLSVSECSPGTETGQSKDVCCV